MVFELEKMFQMQRNLQKKIGFDLENPTQEYFNLMFMAIVTEASEALEETPWKPWKKTMTLNHFKLQEEVVDLWHFIINLTIAAGLTPTALFSLFSNKNKVNLGRQESDDY